VDFRYSFSQQETLEKWGHQEILGDFVRHIRTLRPDVIVTMSPEGTGGGQHHQTSAVLATEAFRAAADPAQFPEQIREGLRPWQALKLYRPVGGFGGRATRGGPGPGAGAGPGPAGAASAAVVNRRRRPQDGTFATLDTNIYERSSDAPSEKSAASPGMHACPGACSHGATARCDLRPLSNLETVPKSQSTAKDVPFRRD
jgi:hypothetical protein